MATNTRVVFCYGRVFVHCRIQQQVPFWMAVCVILGAFLSLITGHQRVALSKSQAMTKVIPCCRIFGDNYAHARATKIGSQFNKSRFSGSHKGTRKDDTKWNQYPRELPCRNLGGD